MTGESAADNSRWLRLGPRPIFEHLPQAVAVFDPASGETHFLSDLPALLLDVISSKPVSSEVLCERLAGKQSLDDLAKARILAALRSLEGVELIESQVLKGLPPA